MWEKNTKKCYNGNKYLNLFLLKDLKRLCFSSENFHLHYVPFFNILIYITEVNLNKTIKYNYSKMTTNIVDFYVKRKT